MKTKYIIIFFIAIGLISSCDDDFLELYPLDSVVDQNYWNNESDLKLFANSFYGRYIEGFDNTLGIRNPYGYRGSSIPYGDLHSDNALSENLSTGRMVNGLYVIPSQAGTGGWNWENVRDLNFFLANYKKADIKPEIKNIYAGEIMFFKTMEYFNKIKLFGEVPWYSEPLNPDSEALYNPKTPRAALMDSVLLAIDRSVEWLPAKGSEGDGRLNKDMALLLKARVCLYEGTFRKYHTELGLSGEKFLNEAVKASEELMNSSHYSIWSTGDPANDYHNLFIQDSYASNPEIILWKEYSSGLLGHGFLRYYLWSIGENLAGFSRSLMDEYLCSDGLPTSESPLFMGKDSLQVEFKNRDPRLAQTVCPPGQYALDNSLTGSFVARGKGYNGEMPGIRGSGEEFPTPTGYWPIKFWKNDQAEVNSIQTGTMPCPIFRYAEVLLINSEAHAELGTCTQNILDNTINILRNRAGMPNLQLTNLPIDPVLDERYSNYCGYIPDALLREIRRERRVELVWENFRWDDLVRWRAGKLLTVPEAVGGMKFNQYQYPAVVPGSDVFLDTEGFLDPYRNALPGGRIFEEPKNYYFPIPIEDLVINPNLTQSPGWEN
ncbi:RagB/SusD family nutrient uptake outer membrane protein [Arenibacter algicola]|uniref:RagB/SusD family nutrient uptake outer membrane protein n=1 Tax=Arenibacter algicola TaxID=616991 RepID=UPI001C07B94C|nr:RagB/SusD family nutrient uptake outer membrane protein [Arenibacter algicola]MBU2904004.1 RagB/SusD family nutrient uptake outer membrane protein [Arenibacter algicola]